MEGVLGPEPGPRPRPGPGLLRKRRTDSTTGCWWGFRVKSEKVRARNVIVMGNMLKTCSLVNIKLD